MLEKYHVSGAFFGDDHNYQHYLKNGIHYVVTGGGGAPVYDVDKPAEGNYCEGGQDGELRHGEGGRQVSPCRGHCRRRHEAGSNRNSRRCALVEDWTIGRRTHVLRPAEAYVCPISNIIRNHLDARRRFYCFIKKIVLSRPRAKRFASRDQSRGYAAFSISFISASESASWAAFMFSSRCATEEVPGIGRITALRWSSHAMES